jgi:hypothetical protein
VKISSREKKLFIIGVIIIAAGAIVYAILTYMPDDKDISRKLDELEKTYLKEQATLKKEPIFQQQKDQYVERLKEDKKLLLSSENPTVAGAELLKVLKDFADQSGLSITSRNNLPPENKKDVMLTKISARIDTTCDIEQLVPFLCLIQNYQKYLKIDELTINSFRMPVQKKYEIRPSLTISGYINMPEEKQIEKPAVPGKAGGRASP